MEMPKLFDHPVFHDDRGVFNQQPIVDYGFNQILP